MKNFSFLFRSILCDNLRENFDFERKVRGHDFVRGKNSLIKRGATFIFENLIPNKIKNRREARRTNEQRKYFLINSPTELNRTLLFFIIDNEFSYSRRKHSDVIAAACSRDRRLIFRPKPIRGREKEKVERRKDYENSAFLSRKGFRVLSRIDR